MEERRMRSVSNRNELTARDLRNVRCRTQKPVFEISLSLSISVSFILPPCQRESPKATSWFANPFVALRLTLIVLEPSDYYDSKEEMMSHCMGSAHQRAHPP